MAKLQSGQHPTTEKAYETKSAIANIVRTLQSGDFYGVSEEVEIAKGREQIPKTWKVVFRKIKRRWQRNMSLR